MAGAKELQLHEIIKKFNSKKLICIEEINELIEVCYRVLSELVVRTKQRENWKKRAEAAELALKDYKKKALNF